MIENKTVAALAESIANAPRKDRQRTLDAFELAYKAGKVDGAIESLGSTLERGAAESAT